MPARSAPLSSFVCLFACLFVCLFVCLGGNHQGKRGILGVLIALDEPSLGQDPLFGCLVFWTEARLCEEVLHAEPKRDFRNSTPKLVHADRLGKVPKPQLVVQFPPKSKWLPASTIVG